MQGKKYKANKKLRNWLIPEMQVRIRQVLSEKRGLPIGTQRSYKVGKYTYERVKTERGWQHIAKPSARLQPNINLKHYRFVVNGKSGRNALAEAVSVAQRAYSYLTAVPYVPDEVALKRFMLAGGIRNFPRGTEVRLTYENFKLGVIIAHPRRGTAQYIIDMKGSSFFHANFIHVNKTGRGLGAKIFFDMVEGARKMGFEYITMLATRGNNTNGYYSMPRMGASVNYNIVLEEMPDMPIKMSKILARHTNLSDAVNRNKQFREWWKRNGVSLPLVFWTSKEARDYRTLQKYMRRKNIDRNGRHFSKLWGNDYKYYEQYRRTLDW